MAYRRDSIVRAAVMIAAHEPRLTLAAIARRLAVHRHTLQRALAAGAVELNAVKRAAVLDALNEARGSSPPRPIKDIWVGLGFTSASSFAKFVRRALGAPPSEVAGIRDSGHIGRKKAN